MLESLARTLIERGIINNNTQVEAWYWGKDLASNMKRMRDFFNIANVNEKNNIKSRENRAFRKPNETTIYKKEKNISILKSEIKKICDDYLSKEQFALIKTMHIG